MFKTYPWVNEGPKTNHSSNPKAVWHENSISKTVRIRKRNVIGRKKLEGNF